MKAILEAYGSWAEGLAADGWRQDLLTFMFKPIGSDPTRIMEQEVERVYGHFVTRVVRNPRAPSAVGCLPIWFCGHDQPVAKHDRQSVRDIVVNGGRHVHAMALTPPWSRWRGSLEGYFLTFEEAHVRRDRPLDRIHVEPVTHRPGYVTDYTLKSSHGRRLGPDATFILPRSQSELGSPRD